MFELLPEASWFPLPIATAAVRECLELSATGPLPLKCSFFDFKEEFATSLLTRNHNHRLSDVSVRERALDARDAAGFQDTHEPPTSRLCRGVVEASKVAEAYDDAFECSSQVGPWCLLFPPFSLHPA
jgi:hypothetical protein